MSWIIPEVALKIAERHGTPTHALNLERLRSNYSKVCHAFSEAKVNMTVLYSVKTNYMPIILSYLRTLGCGVDVVSGPELSLALKLGFPPERIVFNGPHKTDDELETAIRERVAINIDSVGEAYRLNYLANLAEVYLKVGMRVNPGVAIYHSEDPTFNKQSSLNAKQSKFGFTIDDGAAEEAIEAIRFGKKRLVLNSIHCHLGSQITDKDAFVSAIDKVIGFVSRLKHEHPIDTINFGGGFGVAGIRRERRGPLRQLMALYDRDVLTEQRNEMDISSVAQDIATSIQRHDLEHLRFFCEPGRSIVSDAMCMIARVSSIKRTGGLDWLVLDAGLNMFPTIAMAESHKFVPLTRVDSKKKRFRIGGPLCYEGDVLATSQLLPENMQVGDLVSIEDSGAYTVSRSTNFIRPRAAVVVVTGDQIELCWRRETFDDIFTYHVSTSHDLGSNIYE